MLRRMILAAAAVLALGFGSQAANAQALGVNCSVLSGTPYVCIKNASNVPVMAVTAVASMSLLGGASWVNIPGGTIQPGGTTIVRFPTWSNGCIQFVVAKTMDGQTHSFGHQDVCHATGLIISW